MQLASQVINAQQRSRIEAAVAAAEAQTSCEIVPVVATSSGRYDRAEDLVGLWLAIIGAAIVWLALPRSAESGAWNELPAWGALLILVVTMLVCFIAGAVVASRVGVIRRLFTPKQHMTDEVNARARQLFFDRRIHHTAGASGLLIYVSLFEHIAVVLGDRNVVESLGESFPEDLCRRLTADLKEQPVADSLCDVIQRAGESLAPKLPSASGNVNELPDTLVLID